MAEDITLKGVKVIRYNSEKTGDFTLVRPDRGGDTHMLPKWWDLKANNQVYLDCTVLEIDGNHLVIDTQMQSELRIIFDGTDITFPSWRNIERAALFAPGTAGAAAVITDFIFPKVGVRGTKVAVKEGPAYVAPTPPPPADPCDGVTCPVGQHCENGVCVPDAVNPSPTPTPTPTPDPASSETGPKAISGYYPLYDLEASANAAGDGSSHTHTFSGVTYYMPNGVTFYHGNYGQSSGGGY